jgi:DNA-directed RNA polymerase specialized sigma24 family protein
VLGYSREEAARICDVPASTLRSRVSRARERLAAMMAQPTSEWSEH